jgi:signal peptidase I
MATGLARLVVGADPRRTLLRIGVLVVAAWLLITYGILSVRGQGPSMLPTVKDGQLMIVDTVSYRLRRPRRGELAAVRWEDDRAVLIKRILAGPGDTIGIDEGVVTVNDVALAEPYVQHRARWNMRATTLTPDQFFVVGDNRGMPMAQHTFGTVDRADLIGPVFWIVGR